jgi:MFS family permease
VAPSCWSLYTFSIYFNLHDLALARFGRVRCYSGTFLLGGLASVSVAVILWTTERGSYVWLIFSLAMLGKFLIAAAFSIAYLYTAELFPTPVRYILNLFFCDTALMKYV